MHGALITDAHSRAALAGIRALGRAGVPVTAMATGRSAPALWSRHVGARAPGPPSTDGAALARRVGELAVARGPLVVFPGQEEAVVALARHAAGLPPEAILPYPGGEAMAALSDKAAIAQLSARFGLGSPATLAEGPAATVLAAGLDGPAVVKPRRVSAALPATVICATAQELRALLQALPPEEPVVVQEQVAGALTALSLVIGRDGAVVARLQSRALRLFPAAAGASSLSVTVAPDPALVDQATAMLRSVGWWGLAHLQFLAAADRQALIDVNVRFYGSLPLGLAAGVNLPAAWHRVACGEPVSQEPAPRPGVRYRWLEGDVLAALGGDPRRVLTRPARRRAGAVWAADDPVPSVLATADVIRQYAPSALRRLRG